MALGNPQLHQRGKRKVSTRVWDDAQLKNPNIRELDTMVLGLPGRALRAEVPLLAYDFME